jgi:signal peptidase I
MRLREMIRWVREPLLVIGLVLVTRVAVAEPFYVPSGSMEPTLQIGDELLASKFAYGYGLASLPLGMVGRDRVLGRVPSRGDVVVFRYPGNPAQAWVKRVIGLPGDRVALSGGQVWINGTPAPLETVGTGGEEEDDGTRILATRMIETLPNGVRHPIWKLAGPDPRDDMAEITVPPGHLFVMGDNRDRSADSRIPLAEGGVGLLPVGNVIGRADVLVGSWDAAYANAPVTRWPAGLRLDRFFTRVR